MPKLERNKTVLVDMDGVLVDFDGAVVAQLQADYPDIKPLECDTPAFYTAENYPAEHRSHVWAISNAPGFIAALPLVAHAVQGLERILEAGYRPQICSTVLPVEYAPNCKQEKIASLQEHFVPHFGAWIVETALFTPDKYAFDAVALIDDKPPPLAHYDQASWQHLVFDRPCNRTPEAAVFPRLRGWNDPDLEALLVAAEAYHVRRLQQ